MNDRCAWGSKSAGRGVCDQPCEGRYCERHAKTAAVREAGAALRAAREAVAKAREAVVEAADLWECGQGYRVGLLEEAVRSHRVAVGEEVVARARLEALR